MHRRHSYSMDLGEGIRSSGPGPKKRDREAVNGTSILAKRPKGSQVTMASQAGFIPFRSTRPSPVASLARPQPVTAPPPMEAVAPRQNSEEKEDSQCSYPGGQVDLREAGRAEEAPATQVSISLGVSSQLFQRGVCSPHL